MSRGCERGLIVGTGLIGGSLAGRIRSGAPETSLVGIQDVEIVQTKGIGKRAGKSRVGTLYPPDWRGTVPL